MLPPMGANLCCEMRIFVCFIVIKVYFIDNAPAFWCPAVDADAGPRGVELPGVSRKNIDRFILRLWRKKSTFATACGKRRPTDDLPVARGICRQVSLRTSN